MTEQPAIHLFSTRGWIVRSPNDDWLEGEPGPMVINPRYIVAIKAQGPARSLVVMESGLFVVVDEDFANFRAGIGIYTDEKFEEMRRKFIREIREKKTAASGQTA